MKSRIKKLFAILMALVLMSGISALATTAASYDFYELNPGDLLYPGDVIIDNVLYYMYVVITDAYHTDAPQYNTMYIPGYGTTNIEDYYNFGGGTLPDILYCDNGVYTPDGYIVFDRLFFAFQLPVASDGEEYVNENGEDFWKWWRNAARLTREQKTVTLNVPADIDNTVIPTFFFTAIKEANANVTLNINGKTYTLNANNLPFYYTWASEVSVEILD